MLSQPDRSKGLDVGRLRSRLQAAAKGRDVPLEVLTAARWRERAWEVSRFGAGPDEAYCICGSSRRPRRAASDGGRRRRQYGVDRGIGFGTRRRGCDEAFVRCSTGAGLAGARELGARARETASRRGDPVPEETLLDLLTEVAESARCGFREGSP